MSLPAWRPPYHHGAGIAAYERALGAATCGARRSILSDRIAERDRYTGLTPWPADGHGHVVPIPFTTRVRCPLTHRGAIR